MGDRAKTEERIESCTMSPAEDCVMIGLRIKGRSLRGMMDSGAGRSVIDIGTLEMLSKDVRIEPNNDIHLCDASNNKMDVLGCCSLSLHIPKLNKRVTQEFTVLNVKTYKNLLLGRDFFKKMGPVTIDVGRNRIKICERWIKGEAPRQCVRVRTHQKFTLPARSEHFMCISSKANLAMLDYEFVPAKIFPAGVYVTSACLGQPE